MEVNPTSTGGATGTTQTPSASDSISATFDSFLTLLTTQLRYQDPISPMDTNEFTSQLVQFSQVEQSIQQNDNLETLIALQGANQIAFAASLTGKNVEIAGDALDLEEGESLTYGYSLPQSANTVQINVMDEDGRIVFSQGGQTAAGDHSFVWDGKTTDGTQASDGTYRIQVVATDAAGTALTATTSVETTVEGVELAGGQLALDVGSFTVTLDKVLAIRDRQAAT